LNQSDPWELYVYAIKAPATKAKYCQRLRTFLEFLGYEKCSLQDKTRAFAAKAKIDSNYAFNSLLRFFQMQRERIEEKEIAIGTVRNYAKAIKQFYEMADIFFTHWRTDLSPSQRK
jgi:predicted xylose isomerase-like sugar epimerase